jgi:serine/threonine-protein kinase RsbW
MSETAVVDARDDERDRVHPVRLRIPAKPEYIAVARLAVAGLAELAGVADETVADLKLALTEAVSNSIRHAYKANPGHVEIAFGLGSMCLDVTVIDNGAGFDPERPPALEGEELAEGGLGIAIIRTLTDSLEIESRSGVRGTRLHFVKHFREQ